MKLKLQNERGQATIESVLILTVLLAISLSISEGFTKNNFFASLIEGPWDFVSGMITDGVWLKSTTSHALNPNARTRHASKVGMRHKQNLAFDTNLSQLK